MGYKSVPAPSLESQKKEAVYFAPKTAKVRRKCFHIVYPLNYVEKHSANNSSEKAERPHTYGYTRKHVPVNVRPLNHIATSPAKAEFLSLPPKRRLIPFIICFRLSRSSLPFPAWPSEPDIQHWLSHTRHSFAAPPGFSPSDGWQNLKC